MSATDDTNAARRGSGSNDLLGLAPAYLGDGQTAYAAGIVASWPEHNRARFRTPLFTGEHLELAVAAERERWECVQRDHQRLVRELDAALNGADRAAPQAILCDLVSQVHRMVRDGLIVGA